MALSPQGVLAIVKLVLFAPQCIAKSFVLFRHDFAKSSCWVFLIIFFCLIRPVGSTAQLVPIHSASETFWTIAGITEILGLSKLSLAPIDLIVRVIYGNLERPWSTAFSFFALRIIQAPAGVDLILCTVGATSAFLIAQIGSKANFKAGLMHFLVVFIALSILNVGATVGHSHTKRGEVTLTAAVAGSLHLMLLCIIYSPVGIFAGIESYKPITGFVSITTGMETTEDFVVVCVYLFAGFKLL